MRFFGLEITRAKAAPVGLQAPSDRGWFPIVREPFTGAWQRNREIRVEDALGHPTVFACISLIAGDFSKLRVKLAEQRPNDVWVEVESPAFSPVLRKPNRFQTRNQFYEAWAVSKLSRGNTVVLKERDARGVVVALYILDWSRVTPLVAPDGSVFYRLSADNLAGMETEVVVPASEIIHDRFNCFYHPLIGLSPLYAAALLVSASQAILNTSASFFENGAQPGGILTHPDFIDEELAKEYARRWRENYGGANAGNVAVLGNGLKFETVAVKATDAQLVERLKWTDEKICGIFKVPAYMVGVGSEPLNNNVEALAQGYYSRCLQKLFEDCETCLDEGLGIGRGVTKEGNVVYGAEFDLAGLLRMDTATQVKTLADAVKGALLKPNEARAELNREPAEGGDEVYLQQQNYSLPALAKRDAKEDPFGTTPPPAPAPPTGGESEDEEPEPANDDEARASNSRAVLAFAHKRVAAHARS
jgi:HK97 family phage portal protein